MTTYVGQKAHLGISSVLERIPPYALACYCTESPILAGALCLVLFRNRRSRAFTNYGHDMAYRGIALLFQNEGCLRADYQASVLLRCASRSNGARAARRHITHRADPPAVHD